MNLVLKRFIKIAILTGLGSVIAYAINVLPTLNLVSGSWLSLIIAALAAAEKAVTVYLAADPSIPLS